MDPKPLSFGKAPDPAPAPAPAAYPPQQGYPPPGNPYPPQQGYPPPYAPPYAPTYAPPAATASTALAPAQTRAVSTQPITQEEFVKLGTGASKTISRVASEVTGSVKMGDMDAFGKDFGKLMDVAREYDPSRWNKGLLGLIMRKTAKQIDLHVKSVNDNVDSLSAICKREVSLYEKRYGQMIQMRKDNADALVQLQDDIATGDARIAWAEANAPAVDPNDPRSVQYREAWDTAIIFAKHQVQELAKRKVVAELTDPQIKMTADSALLLVQAFNDAIDNQIPELKRAYAIWVVQQEMSKGVALKTAMNAEYKSTLERNAAAVGATALKVQDALAQGSVTLETLSNVYNSTQDGLKKVQDARTAWVAQMAAERPQLEQISRQTAGLLTQGA